MIAICVDTPSQVREGKHKHGLKAPILSDANLTVTDKFGLRNINRAVKPGGVVGLPVPTTLYVDHLGIVRWKDQAEDYQRRSDPARVLAGIKGSDAN